MASRDLDPAGCEFVKPYAESVLQDTLEEWEALLKVIEGRIQNTPSDAGSEHYLLNPEELQKTALLQRLNLITPSAEDATEDDLEPGLNPSFLVQFLTVRCFS